ncbi:SctK family type III secretion system sorting platform protein VscK [Vibrio parahaemolyticus]|nr:type III secretion protein [Vibrio parahaemolyticus]EGQ9497381.1 type III secretion protein [Vibrio parahaemolyticus]EGQ9506779.1 type III secretion protein [Vibrio parahaemolyticus]EGQ9812193.1 type III secretion protein [Vibrio parahaemolyticus]EGR0043871.1 type III secretion protein [Vibrio parahaemolyticus]
MARMSRRSRGAAGAQSVVKPETPIAQVLHQFNYCPCQYLEQNWIVPKQPWLLNLDGWRDNPNFNLWCLEEWALAPVPETAFNKPHHSLALLPPDALSTLMLTIGGALHSFAMRQVVLKKPKQCLNNVFGLDIARFLIQQGPMLLSQWPKGWQKALPDMMKEDEVERHMLKQGYAWMKFILASSSHDILLRWQFKLDQSLSQVKENTSWLVEEQRDLAYRLTKKIAKQVIPQWFHLLK